MNRFLSHGDYSTNEIVTIGTRSEVWCYSVSNECGLDRDGGPIAQAYFCHGWCGQFAR